MWSKLVTAVLGLLFLACFIVFVYGIMRITFTLLP